MADWNKWKAFTASKGTPKYTEGGINFVWTYDTNAVSCFVSGELLF